MTSRQAAIALRCNHDQDGSEASRRPGEALTLQWPLGRLRSYVGVSLMSGGVLLVDLYPHIHHRVQLENVQYRRDRIE